MLVFLIILAAILVLNGVMLAALSRQFGSPLPPTHERVQNYAPMRRLLNLDELLFLRSQPGFTPGMESRLRRQRAALFSLYLKSLQGDFREACDSLKMVMVHSATDRHDLASMVLRNQVQFAWRVAALRFHVALYRWGIGTVDVAGVFQPFDALRSVLQTLAPVAQPSIG